MKFNYSILKILLLIFVVVWSLNFSFATEYPSCESAVMTWFNVSSLNNSKSLKDMTQEFCKNVSNTKCNDIVNMEDTDYFDANQSVFLTLLCDNVGVGKSFDSVFRNGDDSILEKRTFSNFGIYNLGADDMNFCDYNTNIMNGCDFYVHIPNMFNEIINDYFNIGQARIYGIKGLEDDFDPMLSSNEFSEYNFGFSICDPMIYYYDASCKYLQNYMKNARNLLTRTKVIDVKKISELNKDVDCDNKFSENILYCGLLGSNNNFNDDFINVVYNEYMWYRLFMIYYSINLSQNPNLSDLDTNSNIERLSNNKEKILGVQQNTFKIREAMTMSFRSLSEISGTFPLHIGLVMYQENANIFMKDLAKIYTPIRTLFDKLRNVQKAE